MSRSAEGTFAAVIAVGVVTLGAGVGPAGADTRNRAAAGSATTAPGATSLAPLVDGPFDRPRESADATGLTLTVRDLVFPPARDLVFTVRSLDNSINRTDSGPSTDVSLSNDVLFAFGKSSLTPAAGALLRQVAADISARARGPVSITGHTDSIGSPAVNLPLSRARAAAVLAALKPLVTAPVTFTATGKGAAAPVASNTVDGKDNPRGRALNRRVTIAYSTS